MTTKDILVVDDEPDIGKLLCEILEDEGFNVRIANNGHNAKKEFYSKLPDIVLLDIWMPDIDGISLLKEWYKEQSSPPIIMMSGHGNIETAIEATRHGAYDFIEKPLSTSKLLFTIKKVLDKASVAKSLDFKTTKTLRPIGNSQLMRSLNEQIKAISEQKTPTLIIGELGTEKEYYARYIHLNSHYQDKSFSVINANNLNHADANKSYLDQLLNCDGMLLIKNVEKLNQQQQTTLLNELQQPSNNNVKLLFTTCHDLKVLSTKNKFNNELYYELYKSTLRVPPLRDHVEDISDFLGYYINFFVEVKKLPYKNFSVAAQNRLRSHLWLGNIRELKILVHNLLLYSSLPDVDIKEIDEQLAHIEGQTIPYVLLNLDVPFREAREHFEKIYLKHQLDKTDGNISKTAKSIGIERTHLYRKLKSLGIELK